MLVSPAKFQDYCCYKYVVFTDGTILFCDILTQHITLKSFNTSLPIGAGTIKFNENTFSFSEKGSFSLNLNWKNHCQKQVIDFLAEFGYVENEGEAFY